MLPIYPIGCECRRGLQVESTLVFAGPLLAIDLLVRTPDLSGETAGKSVVTVY